MFLLAPKLKKLGFNERVLTLDDFDKFCENEGIIFHYNTMTHFRGLYTVVDSVPCISVSNALRPLDRQVVAWHEGGHHVYHSHKTAFFCDSALTRKSEYEANCVAAIALMPRPLLDMSFNDLQEELGYSRDLLWFRKRIFEHFGL